MGLLILVFGWIFKGMNSKIKELETSKANEASVSARFDQVLGVVKDLAAENKGSHNQVLQSMDRISSKIDQTNVELVEVKVELARIQERVPD